MTNSIWKVPVTLALLNEHAAQCMVQHIGIEFTDIGSDYISARMPVDHRTTQPFGLLHGGASVVLAETLGSSAGGMCVNIAEETVVGLEINANHIKGVRSGWVYGTAKPLHIGRKTQVWEVRIENEKQQLVCISRLTLAVVSLNL